VPSEKRIETSRNTGDSIFAKRRVIFSCTSLTLPMNVYVPRPNCAARVMKCPLGAEPIPTVKRRDAPRRSRISLKRSSSLPTAPSVTKITWRR
jgi:hypothetical protein